MTTRDDELRNAVREHYDRVAVNAGGCCGPSCGCSGETTVSFADSYAGLAGHVAEADLALGCGLPTEAAGIRPGERVLDLGSGAGNDAFVAAALAGPRGRVIGVDMTPSMVARAREIAARRGIGTAEFRLGEIEHLPVEGGSVDLVVSNCVLNLVPDKARAFAEMFRVIAPGGRFAVSDTVLTAPLPESLRGNLDLYAGCVSGSLPQEEYLRLLASAGFVDIRVNSSKPVPLPADSAGGTASGTPLASITVTGWKPLGPDMPAPSVRPAAAEDGPLIRQLLDRHGLPTESLGRGVTTFFVAESGSSILGCAGLEHHGGDALLRSFAVRPSLQDRGIGSLLVRHALREARGAGATRAVLLTETAAPFFARFGFRTVGRDALGNPALLASSEFALVCPSGATAMVLPLDTAPAGEEAR